MIEKNVNLSLMYELENLHHVVVQATNLVNNQIFALQLLHKQTDIIVYQAEANRKHIFFDEDNPIVYLSGMAGGHTQTWVYSGKPGNYFIGTKPKKHGHILWDTQIARVNINGGSVQYDSNTEMPRLSYLNRAGSGFGDGSVVLTQAKS